MKKKRVNASAQVARYIKPPLEQTHHEMMLTLFRKKKSERNFSNRLTQFRVAGALSRGSKAKESHETSEAAAKNPTLE
jgi:hypothetical protein